MQPKVPRPLWHSTRPSAFPRVSSSQSVPPPVVLASEVSWTGFSQGLLITVWVQIRGPWTLPSSGSPRGKDLSGCSKLRQHRKVLNIFVGGLRRELGGSPCSSRPESP